MNDNHTRRRVSGLSDVLWQAVIPGALTFSIGLLITFHLSRAAHLHGQQRVKSDMARMANNQTVAMQRNVESYLGVLHSLATYFTVEQGDLSGDNEVERFEFWEFVKDPLARYPAIQSLAWVPRVREGDREEYEFRAQDEGLADFGFTEHDGSHLRVPASIGRGEYFPVYYVEPLHRNEASMGFDLSSDPLRMSVMQAASEAGKVLVTPVQPMLQDHAARAGVEFYQPVFTYGRASVSPAERRKNLQGYVMITFSIDAFVREALSGFESQDIRFACLAMTAAGEERAVFTNDPDRDRVAQPGATEDTPHMHATSRLQLPGRAWRIRFYPGPDYRGAAAYVPVTIFVGGLILSILLGIYFSQMVSRKVQVERLVRKRTAELRKEIAVREKAQQEVLKLSRLVEQNPHAVLITDPDGVIEYVNPMFTEATGFAASEVIGCTPGVLKSETTPQEVFDDLWHTIKEGRKWEGEIQNKKKSGDYFWHRVMIAPIRGSDGEISHFASVQEDITEQRVLHEQLMQSQKMEVIGKLVGGVAHDFNNMLTTILGFSEILREEILASKNPVPSQAETLDEVIEAGRRAANLTLQLLTFARKQVVELQPLDLSFIVRDTEKFLRRTIGEDIDLEMNVQEDIGSVRGDAGQINQVLMNLAVNARDAMRHGGTLTIGTRQVVVTEADPDVGQLLPPGDYVLLSAADTGCGMPKEVKDRIFEPFFTTKDAGQGTGIGLSTVFGIVQQMKGSIVVKSEVDEGTDFRIYLPVHARKATRTPRQGVGRIPGGQETILIIEDEESVRRVMASMLGNLGYRVLQAGNAREAYAVFSNGHEEIDLLIVDIVMPGTMGPDIVDHLAEEGIHVNTIYTSGFTEHPRVHEKRMDKSVRFIQKPFSRDILSIAVREALDAQKKTA